MVFVRFAVVAAAVLVAAPALAGAPPAPRVAAAAGITRPVVMAGHGPFVRPGRNIAVFANRPYHHAHVGPRTWTSFGPTGWGAPVATTVVIAAPGVLASGRAVLPTSADLPTAADLPVANIVRDPADPPLLYVVNDLSRGRSARPGGARIISAGPSLPLAHAPGGTPSDFGPRVIELTAR